MIPLNEVVEPCNNPELPPVLAHRATRAATEETVFAQEEGKTGTDASVVLGVTVSTAQLAAKYKVSTKAVYVVLRRYGIPVIGHEATSRRTALYNREAALVICEAKFIRKEGGKGHHLAKIKEKIYGYKD